MTKKKKLTPAVKEESAPPTDPSVKEESAPPTDPSAKEESAPPTDPSRLCPLCGSDVLLQAKRGSLCGVEIAGWGQCPTCGLWFVVRRGTPGAEMV